MTWTALVMAALRLAVARYWSRPSIALFIGPFLLAIGFLHTAWESTRTIPVYNVLAVNGLAALTWIAHPMRERD